eukprot:GHRR01011384.1.p1 GENE.GHRR01011384.1~~GHRR01011384.1.p1  ORF type:complete len:181 (-),score=40.21 GHRR01011384.1:909-1451(-)
MKPVDPSWLYCYLCDILHFGTAGVAIRICHSLQRHWLNHCAWNRGTVHHGATHDVAAWRLSWGDSSVPAVNTSGGLQCSSCGMLSNSILLFACRLYTGGPVAAPQLPVQAPVAEPEQEPVSSFNFPPGLIPQLVRDKSKYSEPYAPIEPKEIDKAGLPPPPEKDAYLKSRLDKFMLEVRY